MNKKKTKTDDKKSVSKKSGDKKRHKSDLLVQDVKNDTKAIEAFIDELPKMTKRLTALQKAYGKIEDDKEARSFEKAMIKQDIAYRQLMIDLVKQF